jgi:hypothetical protein
VFTFENPSIEEEEIYVPYSFQNCEFVACYSMLISDSPHFLFFSHFLIFSASPSVIAEAGGLLGLFLGCSLLSIIDVMLFVVWLLTMIAGQFRQVWNAKNRVEEIENTR